MEYLSQERYNEISAELDNLINVEFPKIKDAISEAPAATFHLQIDSISIKIPDVQD